MIQTSTIFSRPY